MKKSCLLIFILIFSMPAYSVQLDSLTARKYLLKGDSLKMLDYDAAIKAYQVAAEFYDNNSPNLLTDCFNKIADLLKLKGEYDSALVVLGKSFHIIENEDNIKPSIIISAYITKAKLLEYKGQESKVLENYQLALDKHRKLVKKEDALISFLYNNRGGFYAKNGDFGKANEDFLKALDINLEIGADSGYIAVNYNNISYIYRESGDYYNSLEYAKKSLEIKQKLYGKYHPSNIYGYLNMVDIYSALGEYEIALDYLKKANEIRKKENNSLSGIGYSYYEQANIYGRHLKDYYKGLEYCEKAISHFKKFGTDSNTLAGVYQLKGSILYQKARNENKLHLITASGQALDSAMTYAEKVNNYTIISEINITKVSGIALAGDVQLALKIIDENITKNCPQISQDSDYETNVKYDCLSKTTIVNQVQCKLAILLNAADSDNNSNVTPEMIKASFNLFDDLLNYNLIDIYEGKSRDYLITRVAPMYESVFEYFYNSHDYIAAFNATRRLKAKRSKYLSLLSSFDSKKSLLDSLQLKKQTISSQIDFIKSQNLSGNSAKKDSLLILERTHEQVINEINRFLLKEVETFESKGELKTLEKEHAIIDFFKANDHWFASYFLKDQINIRKLGKESNIQKLLQQTKQIPDSSYLISKELLPFIFEKQFSEITRITFIPDGHTWGLNFESLLLNQPKTNDQKKYPYLFKKYAVNYIYSYELLFSKPFKREDRKTLLAFSFGWTNQVKGNKSTIRSLKESKEDLPGSLSEISALAGIIQGDYFRGSFASEKQFKKVAKNYQILHLAVHGDVDNVKPENSSLSFYAKGDDTEDGLLHVFELQNMRLKADLAVLSACNTGIGKIARGDGIISLGRAFSYAGVNSLLLTRNEVSDISTPEIIKSFYIELKKGKRKSEALQQAKIEFLKNADNITVDPEYWGSFYLLGDDTPIVFSEETEYPKLVFVIISVIGSFILILLILYLKFKPSKKQQSNY